MSNEELEADLESVKELHSRLVKKGFDDIEAAQQIRDLTVLSIKKARRETERLGGPDKYGEIFDRVFKEETTAYLDLVGIDMSEMNDVPTPELRLV